MPELKKETDKIMLSHISAYDYNLPADLIAQHPPRERAASRLLLCSRKEGGLQDRAFSDIVELLDESCCLVVNNTQVLPARMPARKSSGGKSELFFLHKEDEVNFTALTKGRVKTGDRIYPHSTVNADTAVTFSDYVTLEENLGEGQWRVSSETSVSVLMERYGQLPLPPYIQRNPESEDDSRYQTVYAAHDGSVAAPTAGLHFSQEILNALKNKGIEIIELTLHVGIGTFRPIKVDNLDEHTMHTEYYSISPEAAERINTLKAQGKKLLAVGTTSVRTLESATGEDGLIKAGHGETRLFIRPGYRFRAVDSLLTNFHLPKSSLLVMISAFMGNDLRIRSYEHAVEKQYRFFSYGDAMLIL